MRVSFKCDYAYKAVLDIGMYSNKDSAVSVSDISTRQDIPFKYLEQILSILKKEKIVQSKRGPGGGYILARPLKNISLKEVVEAIDGPIEPITCFGEDGEKCADEGKCPFQNIWAKMGKYERELLSEIDFGELAHEKIEMSESEYMFHI